MAKEKKSFKKYATKHLAGEIVQRRSTQKGRKEKAERIARRKRREKNEAQAEERQHKQELEALKDQDPGFYSYLEEEDPTLLQFGTDDVEVLNEQEGSDAETDEDEAPEGGEEGAGAAPEKEEVTRVSKKELDAAVQAKNSGLLVNLFISAAREIGAKIRDSGAGRDARRKFTDPAVLKDTLVLAARALSGSVSTFLKPKEKVPSFNSARDRTLVKRFLLGAIAVTVDCGSDTILSGKLLEALRPFVPILHLIRGCTKAVLKVALSLCSHETEAVRKAAYLLVRSVATRAAGSRTLYQSAAFKGIFLTLIRTAHTYTLHAMPLVGFLMNCVVDLYGTDTEAAYQHAFVYLRQLAIYLRAALQQQSQNNIRTVFNWQFVTALRVWGLVVSAYSAPEQLGPLVHPVVQLGIGAMDLFSSPRCYPMHLHIIEMLNYVGARCNVYIPVATYILRILSSPSLKPSSAQQASVKHKTRPDARGASDDAEAKGSEAQTDLQLSLRVRKGQQRSPAYIASMWRECLYLLTEHLACHCHTIGFPEAFGVVSATLNRLRKDVRVPKLHAQLNTLLQHFTTVSKAIQQKRSSVSFGPCDATAVKLFEDELRRADTKTSPVKALAKYYDVLRAERIAEFNAKLEPAASGKGSGRTTLENVLDGVQRTTGKKARHGEAEDSGRNGKRRRTE